MPSKRYEAYKFQLATLIGVRNRFMAAANKLAPWGAPMDQWMMWVGWKNDRRDVIDAAIKDLQYQRREQQRSKANYEQRSYRGNTKPSASAGAVRIGQ
jgi:hypothetical protein